MTEKNKVNNNIENKENTSKEERKYTKNVWKTVSIASIALVVILLVVIGSGFVNRTHGVTGAITADSAAERALDFVRNYLVRPGTNVSIKDVTEENGLYKLTIELKMGPMSQEVDSYITKDGKLFFPQAFDIDKVKEEVREREAQAQQQETQEVPKSDKPEVHAFVMSHCPFGLQFIKAYVPVMELLGDKADIQLNFVDYIMHGKSEFEDNNRLYCIQKEEKEKLTAYLRCYVQNKGYEACLKEAGIEKAKIDSCIEEIDEEYNLTSTFENSGDRFPPYPIETELNEKYGVRGSPTFVINGKVVRVTRSAEAIKEAVCNAFTTPPEECSETLSETPEKPGFGSIGEAGSSSEGSC